MSIKFHPEQVTEPLNTQLSVSTSTHNMKLVYNYKFLDIKQKNEQLVYCGARDNWNTANISYNRIRLQLSAKNMDHLRMM